MNKPTTTRLYFRKSSYSANSANCVEVADTAGTSAVRDTQNRGQGHLLFPSAEWTALLSTTRSNHH